jgi:hypothetical protein
MGATEEQMRLLSDADVTHVSYILILYSIAFLLYLFVNILLYVYASHAWPDDESNGTRPGPQRGLSRAGPSHTRKISVLPNLNGAISGPANGSARLPRRRDPDQQVRDAEEFELEGLISEGEEDDSPQLDKKQDAV